MRASLSIIVVVEKVFTQVFEQNGEDFVRVDETSVAVDRAYAVRVAVGREAGVVSAFEHRCAKAGDVGIDRLGVEAREKRVALAVDFAIRNPGVFEQPGDAALARSVERIDHEAPA